MVWLKSVGRNIISNIHLFTCGFHHFLTGGYKLRKKINICCYDIKPVRTKEGKSIGKFL